MEKNIVWGLGLSLVKSGAKYNFKKEFLVNFNCEGPAGLEDRMVGFLADMTKEHATEFSWSRAVPVLTWGAKPKKDGFTLMASELAIVTTKKQVLPEGSSGRLTIFESEIPLVGEKLSKTIPELVVDVE